MAEKSYNWGTEGNAPKMPSKEYTEGFKRVFGEDSKKKSDREVKVLTPEQRAKQQAYPY